MKVKLSFVGYLRIEGVRNGGSVTVEPGCTVADFLAQHDVREEHQRYITPIVNGDEKRHSYVLQDNDNLTLFMPVGGG